MLLAVGVHDPGLIGAFAGGMLSFLSPCVLPLVPGYLSMVSGISVAELQAGDHGNVRRIVVSTLLFVAGFTAVFVALGAAASGFGVHASHIEPRRSRATSHRANETGWWKHIATG